MNDHTEQTDETTTHSMELLHQADDTHRELSRMRARRDAQALLAVEEAGRVPEYIETVSMEEMTARTVEEVALHHEHGVVALSTGIPTLDAELGSTLQPGRTILVAADTGGGKTAFTGNLVTAFASQGVPTLLGSFEDQHVDTTKRYLSGLSAINVAVIRDGFRSREGAKLEIPEGFDEGADKLAALGITWLKQTGTIEQIGRTAHKWMTARREEGHLMGVLVIDQLSHLIPSDRRTFDQAFPGYPLPPADGNDRGMMVWQVKMLNCIALEMNLLVVVVMQMTLSQKGHEKPSHHDLREAKAAAFEASSVIIPHRPTRIRNEERGLGEPEWVENTEDRAWLICSKSRFTGRFELEVTWDGEHQRFLDLGSDRRAKRKDPARLTPAQLDGLSATMAFREKWAKRDREAFEKSVVGETAELPAVERQRLARQGLPHPQRAVVPTPAQQGVPVLPQNMRGMTF